MFPRNLLKFSTRAASNTLPPSSQFPWQLTFNDAKGNHVAMKIPGQLPSSDAKELSRLATEYATLYNLDIEKVNEKLESQKQAQAEIELRIQEVEARAEKIDTDLLPLEEIYEQLRSESEKSADYKLLAMLCLSSTSFCGIARLTWWEYSWDILEPVAWAVQSGSLLFWSWYFFVTRGEDSMTEIQGRLHSKEFLQRLDKEEGFSIERYNQLVRARQQADREHHKLSVMRGVEPSESKRQDFEWQRPGLE